MATEPGRARALRRARGLRQPRALRALTAVLACLGATALTTPPVSAAAPWWEPAGFAGQRVDSISVNEGVLSARVGATRYFADRSGHNFRAAPAAGPASSGVPPAVSLSSAGRVWSIRAGVVLTGGSEASLVPDLRAPFLGDRARLLAAPAALPGVVTAAGTDGHVWRRAQDGGWATAFVVLPAGGLAGAPAVTGLAAFTEPLSAAIYLGTDGYGVLLSSNGGDDWIRADPGLPSHVLGLATNAATRSLYAATDSGLWVHRLQAFPSPPMYRDSALYLRWLGIAVVALLATGLAVAGLRVAIPARRE